MSDSIRPKLILIANSAWNLWNFRRAFIGLLLENDFEVVCLAPADGFETNLRTLGVRFFPLRRLSRKSLSPLHNFFTFTEITRHLQREKPALVLLYTIKPNIFGSFAARLSGTPVIATVEGLGYAATAPALFRRLVFLLYRLAFRFVQKVVFLNNDDRAEFIKNKVISTDKTLVIKGTGVDTTHFSPNENTAFEPVFLFIGRLLSDKGIREFIQAATTTKEFFPHARFQALGSPDEGNPASISNAELKHWIDSQSMEYLGQTDDVRPFIAGAGVVVLPSYREGMPRALLEGMAMGKPIITTDSIGCRDTIDDEQNGFIVPAEDAGALTRAMLRFLRLPPDQQRSMARHSRQKALKEFSNTVVLPQYLQLIRDSIK